MKRQYRPVSQILSLGALALLLGILQISPLLAMSQGAYSMEVLVDGRPIQEYAHRGTHYIQAIRGSEYSIRLRNHTGFRVAVAVSVDGLNSIDAKSTTANDASKWILGPYETITLDGWQTSSNTARRFFFTTEEESYGAWMGKTRNLGVLSAVFYRERQQRPAPIYKKEKSSRKRQHSPSESKLGAASDEAESRVESDSRRLDDLAATGIGREVGHSVRTVRFNAESSPAAIFNLRYEYREALVRLGVIAKPCDNSRDPLSRRERARGFEGMAFAPDPFRHPCR